MPLPDPHLDLSALDLGRAVADADAIRKYLPHRHEVEMLTAIVHIDPARHLIVGYKDVRPDEFWVRGHFPGNPIMPGVLLCEAAAQLSAYYTLATGVVSGVVFGLGGIENTRFRRAVRPEERLVLVGKGNRVRPRMTNFNIQGFVGDELAFHTDVIGVVLGRLEES
ncbi:MAG TPA: 3-hydroxyacyl-ACP dehydratase FabZ family protein [Fimbriiglobus sp.]|jgi:3-hydroxyacyl-[acyl-carrier-protein] dehydratase|nr:3-hydroxyacyl-ACP dehydratase FabZ family protein [Fimbriiglobus sp.]